MDAMALLCTLHGDGPTTLARLRQSGFHRLADLEGAEADELGRVLKVSAAAARRFLREASILGARIDEEDEPEPVVAPRRDAGALSGRDRELVDKVLTRWREADAEPVPPRAPEGDLVPGALDGLTDVVCAALREAGVDSLLSLARSEPLRLRDRTRIGFSTLRRLQFLALRATRGLEREARISVSERPSSARTGPDLAPELNASRGARAAAPTGGAVRAWELRPQAPKAPRSERPAHPPADEGAGGPFDRD